MEEHRHGRPWRTGARTDVLAALRVPNYRRWFAGQSISLTGTWMQAVAQSWLVLQLTGSGTVLGLLAAAQFLPVLLFGAYGGLLADRSDKRRLLMLTQTALAVLALALGALTVAGVVRTWMVFALALAFGLVNAVDNPARQSFVPEMVAASILPNAVSLNSVLVSATRTVGPAAAGLLIARVGVGACFLLNAASFTAILLALATMRVTTLHRAAAVAARRGQVRQGLRYVRGTPVLLVSLTMMALVGTLAYEFPVVLPLLVRFDLHGDATTYGLVTAAMGAGAVVGGVATAAYNRGGLVPYTVAACAFGVATLAAALLRPLGAVVAALALAGACGTAFLATGNVTLQLASDPSYRGRVMALWSITFLGSTPIGGPVVGVVSEVAGPRAALGVGAAACLAAALIGVVALRRTPAHLRRARRPPAGQAPPPQPPGVAP